jgi:hypothetical protein
MIKLVIDERSQDIDVLRCENLEVDLHSFEVAQLVEIIVLKLGYSVQESWLLEKGVRVVCHEERLILRESFHQGHNVKLL